MYHIALLERPGGIIARGIEGIELWESGGALITCFEKTDGLGKNYNFIAISPEVAESECWDVEGISRCKMLLVPGKYAAKAANVIDSSCVVSYGLSDRDSITLSSIEDSRAVLAIQRELVTLKEKVLDRQEIPVGSRKISPEHLMALCGCLLILGVPVEGLSDQIKLF